MRRKQQAFTLIELMVTIVVVAIVIGIAIPSFTTAIQNNRSVAVGEDLVTAFNLARAEAVKRNARVSVCASSTGTECVGEWSDGWIVFIDTAVADNAAAPVIANVAAILQVWNLVNNNAEVSETDDRTFIRYTGDGMLGRVSNDPFTFAVSMKGCTGSSARNISIGLSGSVNIARADCQ